MHSSYRIRTVNKTVYIYNVERVFEVEPVPGHHVLVVERMEGFQTRFPMVNVVCYEEIDAKVQP
jgi:hypothetical protein